MSAPSNGVLQASPGYPGGKGTIPFPSPKGEGFTDPLAGTLKGYSGLAPGYSCLKGTLVPLAARDAQLCIENYPGGEMKMIGRDESGAQTILFARHVKLTKTSAQEFLFPAGIVDKSITYAAS